MGGVLFQKMQHLLGCTIFLGATPNPTFAKARVMLEGLLKLQQINLTDSFLVLTESAQVALDFHVIRNIVIS